MKWGEPGQAGLTEQLITPAVDSSRIAAQSRVRVFPTQWLELEKRFFFTFFHVNIVSTSPYTCVVDTPHHVAQTIPTHIIHHKWHVYQYMLVLRAMLRKRATNDF